MYDNELITEVKEYIELCKDNEKVIKSNSLKSKLDLAIPEQMSGIGNTPYKIKFNMVYHNLTNLPLCNCGQPLDFVGKDKASIYITKFGGWREFCSTKCSRSSDKLVDRRRETNMKRYGEISYAKTKQFKDEFSVEWSQEKKDSYNEKRIQTSLDKHGVDHFSKTSDYLVKRTKTTQELYGVDNTFQLTDKIIEGQKRRFNGNTSWLQTEEGIEYLKNDNPMQNPITSEKSRLRRYESDWSNVPVDFVNSIINKDKDSFVKIVDELYEKFDNEKRYISNHLNIGYSTLCRYMRIFDVRDRYISPNGVPSLAEKEIYSFIKELCPDTIQGDRSFLGNKQELDILIPSKKLAIEFNGTYYHSEYSGNKDKLYHLIKTEICESKGYQLLHILEHEWNDPIKQKIWKSIIKQKLGLTENKIFARNCIIHDISSKESRKFLDENHLAGFNGALFHKGLFYGDDLVSVMSIGKDRFSNSDNYEIIRFASILNTTVIGGMSKLFKSFKLDEPIICFADRRISSTLTSSYNNLFKNVTITPPSWYGFHKSDYIPTHRLNYTVEKLKTMVNYDEKLSSFDNMINNGYDRIWDCGNIKFFN